MRYAVIDKSGVVENVIEAAEGFTLPGRALVEADETVAAGWTFDGTKFAGPKISSEPVRTLSPEAFMALFTANEIAAIFRSPIPDVIVLAVVMFTRRDDVDLLSPRLIAGVHFLRNQFLLATDARRDRILAGLPPE